MIIQRITKTNLYKDLNCQKKLISKLISYQNPQVPECMEHFKYWIKIILMKKVCASLTQTKFRFTITNPKETYYTLLAA